MENLKLYLLVDHKNHCQSIFYFFTLKNNIRYKDYQKYNKGFICFCGNSLIYKNFYTIFIYLTISNYTTNKNKMEYLCKILFTNKPEQNRKNYFFKILSMIISYEDPKPMRF